MTTTYNELGIVRRTIDRANPAIVEQLSQLGVATLHEAMGRSTGLMQPYMRPAWHGAHFCGTAVTVLLQPGDNWMLHVAAEQIQPGDVVVAGCIAESSDGFFGDLMATSYKARGARGLVIDGGVRDVDTLEGIGFAVFSRAINARGTIKKTLGSVNIPIVCAGALVNPGDVVIGDTDGVVVVPKDSAAKVVTKAQAREDNETAKREVFASGTLGLDYYDMRDDLKQSGLKYID